MAVVVAPIIIGKKKMDRLGILFAIVIDVVVVVVVFVVVIVADNNVVFIFILVLVSHAKVKAVQEAKVVGGAVMIVIVKGQHNGLKKKRK